MVSFETDALLDKVASFFDEKLPENGWTIAGNVKTADGALITATKENGASMILAIAREKAKDGVQKTTIGMNLGGGP